MKKKFSLITYVIPLILIVCSLAALIAGDLDSLGTFRDPIKLWEKIVVPLMRLTVLISIGLFVGQITEGMGWTNRLSVMARPFMRWGHLTPRMGAVFTTAFFSGTASLSMLKNFHEEGRVDRKEMTISVLLNTFPAFFLHLPTTFFILIPLVGNAGAMYLSLTFGAALLRLFAILAWTRFTLPESEGHVHEKRTEPNNWRSVLKKTGEKFKTRITRILIIVLPVYLIVVLISDMGFFLYLRQIFARGFSSFFVPVEAMSVVIFSLVAEFTSGYAAAGAMLDAGTLNSFQIVLALLLGNIIAAPVRALRHQMPYYMGIFSPGLGVRLMVVSQAFRILSLVMVGAIYFFLMSMVP